MSGGQGQQGGQGTSDQMVNLALIVCTIFGIVILTWLFAPAYIKIPVFFIRKFEILMFKGGLNVIHILINLMHLPISTLSLSDLVSKLDSLLLYLNTANYAQVDLKQFNAINQELANLFRYPLVFFCLIFSLICLNRARGKTFKKKYVMNDLKNVSADNWPQIKPVQQIDLVKQNLEEGVWAMAKTPFDYAKENNLLQAKEIGNYKVWHVDDVTAYHNLSLQLGAIWPGLTRLPIHIKAVAVIFIARLDDDKKLSTHLIRQIALSASHGKLDFRNIQELAEKYQDHKVIRWLEDRHAYIYTLISRLLELTRATGVMATAELLWLKPVDRRLWYVLNSSGRQTAVIEVAGCASHLLAEKKLNRAIQTPMIKEAMRAFTLALNEILREDKGEIWHTKEG